MRIFYHGSDLDGIACGAILTRKYPEATMVRYNYWYDPEKSIDLVEPNEPVIFADITPTVPNLQRLMNITKDITIIDHHASSVHDLKELGLSFPGIMKEDGLGACALAWEWCSKKPLPVGIRYIAEYDDWQRTPENKMFHFGMLSFSTFLNNDIWDYILRDDIVYIQRIMEQGRCVLKYLAPHYTKLLRSYSFYGYVNPELTDGKQLTAIFLNQGGVDSSIFDNCKEPFDVYFRAVFGKDRKWLVSITTTRNDIDVSKIASKFESGGHAKASGFATPEIADFFVFVSGDEKEFVNLQMKDTL
jgi:uncharacterized protein